jgi:XRE family transcriptional regulator, regulator of sulfur utilization
MNLGEKISLQRKNKGLSQELLAENCGISLRTIQRIENNKSQPRPYTLRVIADALNMQMEQLEQSANSELEEDNAISKIVMINTSALLGVLIPLTNIIAPVLFWRLNRQDPLVNEKGKKVISFQIMWFLFSVLTILTTHFLHYEITGEFVTGRVPIAIVVYILLLLVNVFFIIKNAIKLKAENTEIYPFFPNLF